MEWKRRYDAAKAKLLSEETICVANRALFRRFLEFQEYKLKRINGLPALDEKSFKTVYWYTSRLRTVNRWFGNKPWDDLTKADIQRVYDDLEDGKILSRFGKPVQGKTTYYRKIMRGKPFELAGKKDLVRDVMEFYVPQRQNAPRFIPEESFRKLIEVVGLPAHRAFLWLAWDIGENVSSLLQLCKRDARRQVNSDTSEPEYAIQLRQDILKRSRTARMEVTNYADTVAAIDVIAVGKSDEGPLFSFGARMGTKILNRACRLTGVRCLPNGEKVRLKDLRSSMACDLLSKGWSTDEVNRRLGHTPGSQEIKKYVNWLALDTRRPKQRVQEHQVGKLQAELDEAKRQWKLTSERLHRQAEDNSELREELRATRDEVREIKHLVSKLVSPPVASAAKTRRFG